MKKSLSFLALLALIAFGVLAQEKPQVRRERAEFAKAAYDRLSRRLPPGQLESITRKHNSWQQEERETDWIELTDAIHAAGKTIKANCEVDIASSKGPDATVKYQTLGSRKRKEQPTTAKNLTELTESMSVGSYHIWSERGGHSTSDTNAQFNVVKVNEKVTLEEIR